MGGAAKTVAKTVGNVAGTVFTGGLNKVFPKSPFGSLGNDVGNVLTLGTSGQPLINPLNGQPIFKGTDNPYISGPFTLDPNQVAGDQSSIINLGNKQYADTLAGIDTNAKAQQDYAGQTLNRMIPDIEETLNSQHLLNSSALPAEIARQANYSAQDLASQVSNAKLNALTGRQGFETGALQRGLSMEDMINQANISKTIGAEFAPQPPSGKQNFGAVASGIGALSPWAGLAMNAAGKAGGGQAPPPQPSYSQQQNFQIPRVANVKNPLGLY